MTTRLDADTSEDAFLGGALRILQPATGYRAGLDAVLLAAAAPLRAGDRARVLDLGAGVGVVGLAVARRVATAQITMLEREASQVELCRSNIVRNHLTGQARVLVADVTRPLGAQPELAALADSFQHVLANPPYQRQGTGTVSRLPGKAAARAMPPGGLGDWLRLMAAMARPGGSATMIHRADCLDQLLLAFAARFGRLLVFPLYPRHGAAAHRVLVQGIKGSRAALQIRPGLVLHGTGHGFRPEVDAILREGAALDLTASAGS